MKRSFLSLILILVFCFLSINAFTPVTELKKGETAPDFTLKNLAGEEVKLSDFNGKVVILHFWKSN